MRRDRNCKAAVMGADASLRLWAVAAALAAAFFLSWHGMARAEGFNPLAEEKAQLPDSIHGRPGADRVPPGLACPDNMDLTPEDNLPSPFDADLVAWRGGHGRAQALRPIANVSGCPDRQPAHVQKV